MIIKGNTRTGGAYLPAHLLNARDNDHVEVFELRGFASENLTTAVHEVDALAKGTNCKKPWFSTSINPPMEAEVSEKDFMDAIERCEQKLGLNGQPRGIVFHEKEGRRHAHAIWSRIDPDTMKAIPDSYSRLKLQEVSKGLFLEHGWTLPEGLQDRDNAADDISRDDQAIAKRSGLTIEDHQSLITEAWRKSDDAKSFAAALEDQGYILAEGKRGHVAVDIESKDPHSIARRLGLKKQHVEAKLGPASGLPSVEAAKKQAEERAQEVPANGPKQQHEGECQQKLRLLKQQQIVERVELLNRQSDERAHQERSFVLRLQSNLKTFWTVSKAEISRLRNKFLGKDNDDDHAARIFELRKTQEQRFSEERDRLRQEHLRQRREIQRPLEAERYVNRQAIIAERRAQSQHQTVEANKAAILAKLEKDRAQSRKLER